MDILDDMGVSKLSAKVFVFFKVNSLITPTIFANQTACNSCFAIARVYYISPVTDLFLICFCLFINLPIICRLFR